MALRKHRTRAARSQRTWGRRHHICYPRSGFPSHRCPARAGALPMTDDYLERILTARVYDVAVETPLDPAPLLSRRLGNTLLLKREDLQPVFSFKIRGAYNKMSRLSRAQLRRGEQAGRDAQGSATGE